MTITFTVGPRETCDGGFRGHVLLGCPVRFFRRAHQRALALTSETASSSIVTTDEVLTEYLTFFAAAPEAFRVEAADTVADLQANSVIRVIPQSRESFLTGLQLYRDRPEKKYSLVDCIFNADDAAGRDHRSADQ
jgi:hypothetical protein